MACRDFLCGGCSHCFPEVFGEPNPDRDQEEFTENACHALVAAAHDLIKRGNVTDKELRVLEELLAVFDPQEEVAEEADIAF